MSAYAAPLGMIEAGADSFAGQLPTILKVNSANSWANERDQAVPGGVDDALRLGCAAIGFNVYPGSEHLLEIAGAIRERAEVSKTELKTILVQWTTVICIKK